MTVSTMDDGGRENSFHHAYRSKFASDNILVADLLSRSIRFGCLGKE